MSNDSKKVFLFCVIIIASIANAKNCQMGEVQISEKCINCKQIANTIEQIKVHGTKNKCTCIERYKWSESLLQCLPIQGNKVGIISQMDVDSQKGDIKSSRLLAQSCDTTKGVILSNGVCVNCRVIPYAIGINLNQKNCICSTSFQVKQGYCKCPYFSYLDVKQKKCISCPYYSLQTNRPASDCINCGFPFQYSKYGCIYCLSLENNGGFDSCCTTGYRFEGELGRCVCDYRRRYAIGENGVCSECSLSDYNCRNCVNNYVFNTHFCMHGSLIPNFKTTSAFSDCPVGTTIKKDVSTGLVISCACSQISGYYQNGSTCLECAKTLPKGVNLADCKACSPSVGFYLGTVQCVYCPSISFSTGTATVSGCDCLTNYFYNINTAKCQCDFNLGFTGGSIASCINCKNIPFTEIRIVSQGCSCVDGYKWDSVSKTCVCDQSSSSVFINNENCYNCALIEGSTGFVASDKISCVCISGFFWNHGLNKCQCDSSQNFAIYDGECKDCSQHPFSIGLAYNQQCICKNGFFYDSTGNCICPRGYVLIGALCTSCQNINFPSGTIVDDCFKCSESKGFATQNGVCALCSSQSYVSSSVVTNGKCTCPSGMFWVSKIGSCACDFSAKMVTKVGRYGEYTCFDHEYVRTDGSPVCGWSFLYYSVYNVCTDARTDPNGQRNSAGAFYCKTGYYWSQDRFPFRCVAGGPPGQYYAQNRLGGGAALTYFRCNSVPAAIFQQYCLRCDFNQGFLLLPHLNTCLYCPSVTGASLGAGSATLNACICLKGYWNPITVNCDTSVTCTSGLIYNPYTKKCDICDSLYSVTVNGKCISCKADNNSIGYAVNSTACACKASFIWSATLGGACLSASIVCNPATSLIMNGFCFICPQTDGGTGLRDAIRSGCKCKSGYFWSRNSSGGKCVCDSTTKTILSNGSCIACPINANTTGRANPGGGCLCTKSFVWDAKALTCICNSSVSGYVTPSGVCFRCLSTIDPKFDGTIVNGFCNCKDKYIYDDSDTGGKCTCTSPSVITQSGICLTCPTNENTTGVVSGFQCLCYNKFVYSPTLNTCICDETVFAYQTGSGYCFQCLPTVDVNFNKTIVKGACMCSNNFVFVATHAGGSCQCQSPNQINNNGVCSLCPTNANTTGVSADGGCQCKNNYYWNITRKTCICESSGGAFITKSGVCFYCDSDLDPHFNGGVTNGGCNCTLKFTFVKQNNGGSCSCLPAANSFVLSSTGQCFTCPTDARTTGSLDGKGGCACKGILLWDPAKLVCSCIGGSLVMLPNGTCFVCGTKNTYTNSTKANATATACKCISSLLTWNKNGFCDCGNNSAMALKGNSFICVECNSKIRAKSKLNSFACICLNSTILIWNNITAQCDCGLTSVYLGTKCVPCGRALNANGLNTSAPTSCKCLISAMSWNSKVNSCICNSSQVIFTSANGSISCVSCGLKLNSSVTKFNQTACSCYTLFKWVPNKGCFCSNPNAFINIISNVPKCIICNADTYSTGRAANGTGCICFGSLIWDTKTLSCGCSSSSARANNGTYYCAACKLNIFASTPVISSTNCTCVSKALVWYKQGYCACPDITNSVVVGTGATAKCLICNQQIFSNGKSSLTKNSCNCIDQVLNFSNGICDCGTGKAIVVQRLTIFRCVVCNNATLFTKAKVSSKQCSCVSKNLVWSSIKGVCLCNDTNQIVVGSGSNASCSSCVGQYTTIPFTITNCSCAGTGLVFIPSKTTAGSCACPAFTFLTPNFTCIACPNKNTLTTPYECTCAKNSFWNFFNNTCQVCSTVPNASPSGGNIFACSCISGFLWDVMTLKCIQACAAKDNTCMNCNIPDATLDPAINLVTPQGLTGQAAIKIFLSANFTNYNSISMYQCPCIGGFKWDSSRLRCFDQKLI